MLRLVVLLLFAAFPTLVHAENISNFSAVGFDLDTESSEKFNSSVEGYLNDCEVIELDEDDLACVVTSDSGGQLWLGLRKSNSSATLITVNPAFRGEGRFPVKIQGTQSDPNWEPFEYRVSATFGEYDVPILIELADPRNAKKFRDLEESQAAVLDVTAFGTALSVYEDAEAFEAQQLENSVQMESGERIVYAADYFIPSGMFGDQASARASFAGKVLKANLISTGDLDHWQTLVEIQSGATVNMVFDARTTDIAPKPGNVVAGEFWLSAQVPSED